MNKLDKMLRECKPFIKNNIDQLVNGLFLQRGSTTKMGNELVIKKGPRNREKVFGSTFAHYFYNKHSKHFRDRTTNVFSCQCGMANGPTEQWGDAMKQKLVFPIGSNYRLGWFEGLHDFLEGSEGIHSVSKIKGYLLSIAKEIELRILDPNRRFSNQKKFIWKDRSDIASDKKKAYDQIKKILDEMPTGKWGTVKVGDNKNINKINKFLNMLLDLRPLVKGSRSMNKLFDEINKREQSIKNILSKESSSQLLNSSMKGAEVMVKAPDGVYYTKFKVLDKLREKYL